MSIAIDTNVLVRILVQDPTAPNQCAAARRLVTDATAAGEPLLVSLCALLETEWVLRIEAERRELSSDHAPHLRSADSYPRIRYC